MKKLYTLLVVALVGFVGKAQIVNVPDINFKTKLLSSNTSIPIAFDNNEQPIAIDANNDGEIQVFEALEVYRLNVNGGLINDLTGIQSFGNLRFLNCNSNSIISLDVSSIINLQELDCSFNQIVSLSISGLTNLVLLNCDNNQITSLNLNGFSGLQTLSCSYNQISSINFNGLTSSFKELYCISNQLTSLDLSSLSQLNQLYCSSNQLSLLNINGLSNLNTIDCSDNLLTSLNVNGLTSLVVLFCNNNQLTTLNPSGLLNLINLECFNNQLTSLDVTGLTHLQALVCSNNLISLLSLGNLTQLQNLSCGYNQLSAIILSGLSNLTSLSCEQNQITALDVTGLTQLAGIYCSYNLLTSLDVSALSHISSLLCSNNQLTTLDVSNLNQLESLECGFNQLTTLNVAGLPNSITIYANNNQIATLDLAASTKLKYLLCNDNVLTSLDVSASTSLLYLYCNNNNLNSLSIKNGTNEDFNISGNTTLEYICADEGFETETIQYLIDNTIGLPNCHVNSYCSFVPGGTYYTIQGTAHFDSDSNGCDSSDAVYPNFKLEFSDGLVSGNTISDTSGSYHYDVQAGTHTITPFFENPSYFIVSPTTVSVSFPDEVSPNSHDFCIAPNGTHADLEITLIPITIARPGFDATYKLSYKNKGTSMQSGDLNLTFDDSVLDLVTATPSVTAQPTNSLSWNFSNLLPFETREILVTLNVNSPIETPAVNGGDVLHYSATVTGSADETPVDNLSSLAQTVVNSFDPNDKTCLEGTTITPSMVGRYVHYMIRFENDGTAEAQNIVVMDRIDITKFDISTLVPLSGSALYTTRISDTNKVEFIFENINLPFTAGSNTGYVAFKIKTKPTLVVGDTFSNSANIYFDYNYPVVTNTVTTTVQALATQDFNFGNYFSVYPVPAKQVLNLDTKATIGVKSMEVYNVMGQMVIAIPNAESVSTIDVSNLKTGTYFIKVNTDKGTANTKFVKE
jgi:Leucine-rich repeat (LRR) protein